MMKGPLYNSMESFNDWFWTISSLGGIYFLARSIVNKYSKNEWQMKWYEMIFGWMTILYFIIYGFITFQFGMTTVNGKTYKEIGRMGYFKELMK